MKHKKTEKKLIQHSKKHTSKNMVLPKKKLLFYRTLLVKKYNELINFKYTNENNYLEVGDNIDIAKIALDKEISQELTDTQQTLLSYVIKAIEKIDKTLNKSQKDLTQIYGICERCKKPIPQKRLKALPWVEYCINCQRNIETHKTEET